MKNCKNKLKSKIDFLPASPSASEKAQNLVEFVFVFPMLIFLTLVIFEIGFFWQETNAIYNLNAEINANVALLDYSKLAWGTRCPAADPANPNSAISILKKRDDMISLTDNTYNDSLAINDAGLVANGKEPFAQYTFKAGSVTVNGSQVPQITLWVDCRNPFEDGITTQIQFFHKTILMKASIPRFDKPENIVIIPDHILIASPKLSTIRHY